MYSDGIVEIGARSPEARKIGIAKLIEMCEDAKNKNLPDLVDFIPSQIFRETVPEDDIVILGVEV